MNRETLTAVILAAGKGTRMRSSKAKVLHEILGRPMVLWVLDAVAEAGIDRSVVIVGHQRDKVRAVLGDHVLTVVQEEQLGTGDAVLCSREACAGSDEILILCGDTPLVRAQTLEAMIGAHRASAAAVTLMTTTVDNPFGYGRILHGRHGEVQRIVEEKDASPEEQALCTVNAGIYLVERRMLFDVLGKVGTDNAQGEVYLTDIVAIASQKGLSVQAFAHQCPMDVLGVNSRVELAQAQQELQRRCNERLMLAGVTMENPGTTLVEADCGVGGDTVLEAGCRLVGGTSTGVACRIGAGAVLDNCQLGDRVTIGAGAVLHRCRIDTDGRVLPLTYQRG